MLGWPHHKDGKHIYACLKKSSFASFKKESMIVVLQKSVIRPAEETTCTVRSQNYQSLKQEVSDCENWYLSIIGTQA